MVARVFGPAYMMVVAVNFEDGVVIVLVYHLAWSFITVLAETLELC